ncbi:MAG: hypothetical protein ACK47B_08915 [Armatimonadota bacterium]
MLIGIGSGAGGRIGMGAGRRSSSVRQPARARCQPALFVPGPARPGTGVRHD